MLLRCSDSEGYYSAYDMTLTTDYERRVEIADEVFLPLSDADRTDLFQANTERA
jgi:hypothetical protein